MSTKKLLVISAAFLGATLGLVGGAPKLAQALPQYGATSIVVDPIKVRNLRRHAGKYLHVFHVSARDAMLSSSRDASYGLMGTELQIRAIKREPVRVLIPASGEVLIPSVDVPRAGYLYFTHLVFAVTGNEPDPLYLTNANGVNPLDVRLRDEAAWSRLTDRDFEYDRLGNYRVSMLGRKRMSDDGGKTYYLLFDAARDLGL